MAYPDDILVPRTLENRAGFEFDEEETRIIYAEDFNILADDVVALEETVGILPLMTLTEVAQQVLTRFSLILPIHHKIYLASSNTNILNAVPVAGDMGVASGATPQGPARTLNIGITNQSPTTPWVGTVQVSMTDQNGAGVVETLNFVVPPLGSVSQITGRAGILYGAFAVVKTSGNYPVRLSVGTANAIGVPNYPFTSPAQLVHYSKYGAVPGVPTFNLIYGTIGLGTIVSGDEWDLWLRIG